MTMRQIPGAAAVSEFIAGYNGDCGETAEMALLHVINPAAYPLDAAALSTIVKRDIADGWASSNGSEPLSAIAHDLDTLGVKYTNYGYAEPYAVDWRGQLASWGGVKPIVFEYARAASLPGDEAGVAYHFNTCLGWDTAASAGLFADGDNIVERQGGTALVRYTLADLEAAGLCGMLVGEYALGGVMGVPTGWTDNGTVLRSPNGVGVVQGFRDYVLAHPWSADDWAMGPAIAASPVEVGNPSLGAGTCQFFRVSGQLSWTSAKGVYATWNGQEMAALHAEITQLQATIAQLQAGQSSASATAKAAALDALMALYGVKSAS